MCVMKMKKLTTFVACAAMAGVFATSAFAANDAQVARAQDYLNSKGIAYTVTASDVDKALAAGYTADSLVAKAADRMLSLKQQYFPDARTYYAIVPDKNYYQASAYGYPVMDYEKLDNILQKKLTDMSQISLWDTLTIEDYYCTDTHWRQERLQPVVDRIGEQLDFSIDLSTLRKESIYPFYGVYYGQSALPLQPDTICYYTDEIIENVQVWNLEDDQIESVYRPQITEKEGQVDLYDFYLGGASPVQVLTSPQAQTDRKLIIFRDSFGSSLAPLLSEVYHEIILIDTRYISASRLGEYVDFTDADVLFLYNTLLLNHASMLKE